ncbi:SCO2583/SCO2584 N-terminal domain-containing protein [Actinacidiphila acididurans]|uniref:Uncharacterized protein n=1 Tax=Actinacidiphila acididurans TaxID=2784346 RepID=A0ABS2TYA0_9ACTN|nr:hypothetical protein [Actinacidiphila acididurans]MBM9508320.1 hypothetical protein [Actinacidiphila acididurans]
MPDDDEFASVVLDEDFVRSALFHEPTARERMLAVAEGPMLPPGAPGRRRRPAAVPELDDDEAESDELYAAGHPYRGSTTRWHRPVAWALAVVMGIGVVALSFAAVYRGAGGGRQPAPTAPSSGSVGTVDPGSGTVATTGGSPAGARSTVPVLTTPLP